MTSQTITISPQYCSFYISGKYKVVIPLDLDGKGIVATPECINVGCEYWNDGDTTITLGRFEELRLMGEPKFDGILKTPDRVVLLSETNTPEIARATVSGTETRVRIWTNHSTSPDQVTIALE